MHLFEVVKSEIFVFKEAGSTLKQIKDKTSVGILTASNFLKNAYSRGYVYRKVETS